MKIMVVSDIHGSKTAMEHALDLFGEENADTLVCCGDFLNHGPRNALPEGYDTKATAALLNAHKERIRCVRGNCDSEVDQMMLEFPCLNEHLQMAVQKDVRSFLPVFIHHGHKEPPPLPRGFLIVSGHTHIPVLEKRDGFFFLNPGSISIPKGGSEASYALITAEGGGAPLVEIKSLAQTGKVLACLYCDDNSGDG